MDEKTIVTHKNINENADSIELGSPTKGGKVKVYFNAENVETAKDKVAKAKLVRDYANSLLG